MKKSKKLLASATFFLFIILIIALVLILPRLIKIQKIKCSSQYGPCSQEITKIVNEGVGRSYHGVKKNLHEKLVSSSKVENLDIVYQFPNSLEVNVIEDKAIVAIKTNDTYLLIDSDGNYFQAPETSLPTLQLQGEVDLFSEDKLKSKYIFATKIMEKMFLIYAVNKGVLEKDSVYFDLNNGKRVYFPIEGDIDVLFGGLQLIFSRLNQQSNYSIIDLRFRNPIIK